jgi:hypothetical protein
MSLGVAVRPPGLREIPDQLDDILAYESSNVVETALALVFAAEAKRWEVVTQIADELRSFFFVSVRATAS